MNTITCDQMRCASGRHIWLDAEDRRRCCNGYRRVQDTTRQGLEAIGAEYVTYRQLFRGWIKKRED